MQVCVVFDGGGENADAVFTLALAVELLPPLGHEPERRLIAGEDLGRLAELIQVLARGGVLPRGVFGGLRVHGGEGFDRLADHGLHVDAGGGHRQQTDGGQHAVAPADVVGHDERLPALLVGHLLEHAAAGVRRGEDVLFGLLRAVFCLQQAAEHPECERGLERCAGLGNDVEVKIQIAQLLEQVHQCIRRQGVSGEEDLRVAGLRMRPQQLHGALRAEIRPADAHDDERLRAAADARGGGEDLLELTALDAPRQIEPAGKFRTGARVLEQGAVRPCSGRIIRSCWVKKSGSAGQVHFDHSDTFSHKGYHQYTR